MRVFRELGSWVGNQYALGEKKVCLPGLRVMSNMPGRAYHRTAERQIWTAA
jgi:hypothetical protein